jgi:hypothetical protein
MWGPVSGSASMVAIPSGPPLTRDYVLGVEALPAGNITWSSGAQRWDDTTNGIYFEQTNNNLKPAESSDVWGINHPEPDRVDDIMTLNTTSVGQFERTNAFWVAMRISFPSVTGGTMHLIGNQAGSDSGWNVLFRAGDSPSGKFTVQLRNINGPSILKNSNTSLSADTKYTLFMLYSGNSLASGVTFELNGSDDTGTTTQDDLGTNTIVPSPATAVTLFLRGGSSLPAGCNCPAFFVFTGTPSAGKKSEVKTYMEETYP